MSETHVHTQKGNKNFVNSSIKNIVGNPCKPTIYELKLHGRYIYLKTVEYKDMDTYFVHIADG